MLLKESLQESVISLKRERPLILNITNSVAMDFSANALLALGASPIMSLAVEEVPELVEISSAVIINMGTLNRQWLECATAAWRQARALKKPVIFDPVGCGATRYRSEVARSLLTEYGADVVRGNASEIDALLTRSQSTKGVDATLSSNSVVRNAQLGAQQLGTTFVISGATDYICGPQQGYWVANGDPRMTDVTAMGCVSSCLIAAFRAVESCSVKAGLLGTALVGMCGERASATTQGPGSLRVSFLDLLSQAENFQDLPWKVGSL